jgi:hypothetical protein
VATAAGHENHPARGERHAEPDADESLRARVADGLRHPDEGNGQAERPEHERAEVRLHAGDHRGGQH